MTALYVTCVVNPSMQALEAPLTALDLAVPLPTALLIIGLSFLAGFAIGMTVEYCNLRVRERQLARGRRLLAAQARGVREQLVNFYRLRDGAPSVDPTDVRYERRES